MNNFTVFYRGAKTKEFGKGNTKGLWVSEDKQYARMYNKKVHRYKVKNDINILAIWTDTAEELLEEFFRNDITDDIWYNPNNVFIVFLEKKGYDGFINNQNMLLFNRRSLLK